MKIDHSEVVCGKSTTQVWSREVSLPRVRLSL